MATSADWQKNTFYGTDAILPHFTHKFGKHLARMAAQRKTDEAVRFCPENREINSETEPPAQNPKV
jgi:hypothetical protein